MNPSNRLNEQEIRAELDETPGWEVSGGKLRREYRFGDFVAAFSFLSGVALVAERMNHHPDWSNSYSRVEIEIMTHDAGGLTRTDFELARAISRLHA